MGSCLSKDNNDTTNLAKTMAQDIDAPNAGSSDDDNKYDLSLSSIDSNTDLNPARTSGSHHRSSSNKVYTKKTDKAIAKFMKNDEKKQRQIFKLLLLGAGSSGKSTLFRQIENIHGKNQNNKYFQSINGIKSKIRTNCVNSIIKLLKKTDALTTNPYNFAECSVDFNDAQMLKYIKILVESTKNNELKDDKYDTNLNILGEAIEYLWNLNGVRNAFKYRQYYNLVENIDHFLNKISIIMDDDNNYVPDINDILLSRITTTGIIERKYLIESIQFDIYDVGGQRNERKKWITLFDAVNGLIFVAALNHYCTVLFEDETINSMIESLNLFDEICNSKWFTSQHTQFILFLNKDDLFRERLKMDLRLSICFNDKWDGPNYHDKKEEEFMNDNERNQWFECCYTESIDFIRDAYINKNQNQRIKQIFTHVTTATNQNNIDKVFNDVRKGILAHNLADCGLPTANMPM